MIAAAIAIAMPFVDRTTFVMWLILKCYLRYLSVSAQPEMRTVINKYLDCRAAAYDCAT